ncbi:phospholipase D family protein [Agromyces sp. MMS24-K17]|uniref:phospholipase D family protein n=1 Tax=Agromyces sp. MMS24-K17 TaxID=3372850 RepID=UPI003754E176
MATTFTLDLISALSIPLSFAAHHLRESKNPIAILDAVRRTSNRIDIFAQAGQIAVPAQAPDLVAFLEPMVHPVVAPRPGGLFHPKVWVLEYARGEERRYRLLCASRNLTADRSWDVLVRLDGEPSDDHQGMNDPLVALAESLPNLAVGSLGPTRARRIRGLAERLRFVVWESPADVTLQAMHVFGIPAAPAPDLARIFDGKRHLVISPFLSDDGVAAVVVKRSREAHVLSRPESLERLQPETLRRLQGYTLDEAADVQGVDERAETNPEGALVGLHAKVYALDRLDGSHLFIGSANTTGAAFGSNVEALVEFVGPQTRIGVQAIFGDATALRQMAVEYAPEGEPSQMPARRRTARSSEPSGGWLKPASARRFAPRMSNGTHWTSNEWTRAASARSSPAGFTSSRASATTT